MTHVGIFLAIGLSYKQKTYIDGTPNLKLVQISRKKNPLVCLLVRYLDHIM